MPEGSVLEDGQSGNFAENLVVLHPEQQPEANQGGQLQGPVAKDEQEEGGGKKAGDCQAEVLLDECLNFRSEPAAVGDSLSELFVEGGGGPAVGEEEVALECDRGDDE